ncbi:MAG: hypothetical protein HC854_14910 [Flavobacterium sp.]|nr:hypothetical protein [Flavobacterium sp.]
MTTLTIKINEKSKKGKAFLEFAQTFFADSKEVKITQNVDNEETYNSEFVEMVLKSAKSKKRIEINPNDVWGSLGLK